MSGPLPDVLDEGRRLAAISSEAGIAARLLGGAGVALHAHGPIPLPFRRTYGDLDYVIPRSAGQAFRHVLETSGYEPNSRFNALHGHRRLLHYDPLNGRQIDTFVGAFRMCHALDLDRHLPATGLSISPADLLLTKLQIVEVNAKDLTDVLALLAHHSIGDADPIEQVDPRRLASVTGRDWGWYTTISDNLARLEAYGLAGVGIDETIRDAIVDRIHEVRAVIATAPHSIGWRSRAAIGRRMPWYELPEEVAGR
jgi:Uncharacterised nucleotidyltransferase